MAAQTQITFHNGVKVIGGTIVEIRYGDTAILIDFSSEMDSMDLPPEGLQPLIAKGYFPKLYAYLDPAQIFRPEDDQAQPEIIRRAVFLTHAHLDHSLWLNWLDPKVPLYASPETKRVLEALNVRGDFLAAPVRSLPGGKYTREITALAAESPLQLGPIKVEFIPVDHDVPGASGLRIETPDAVIAHTGDFRFHGFRPEETRHFIERCKGCDVLITEGVSVSNFRPGDPAENETFLSEEDLAREVKTILAANPKRNISFNYYVANTERLNYWHKQFKDLRQVVLDEYSAYVLKAMQDLSLPWYRVEKSGELLPGLAPADEVAFDTLLTDKTRFFWQLDTAALSNIGQKLAGGLYIHADAAPLGKWSLEWEPFFRRFHAAGVETRTLSSSGHARTLELQQLIDAISPSLLCPVHSYAPHRLVNGSGSRMLPEKGQTITKNRKGEWK